MAKLNLKASLYTKLVFDAESRIKLISDLAEFLGVKSAPSRYFEGWVIPFTMNGWSFRITVDEEALMVISFPIADYIISYTPYSISDKFMTDLAREITEATKKYTEEDGHRRCKVCGKVPLLEGFYDADNQEYFCSGTCLESEMMRVGDPWQWDNGENSAGGYITQFSDGRFVHRNIFWTTFLDD